MDNYHKFRCAHEVQIAYWLPNYVSITRVIMALSVVTLIMITLSNNSTNGSESADGNEGVLVAQPLKMAMSSFPLIEKALC